jgi:hypothetical protein
MNPAITSMAVMANICASASEAVLLAADFISTPWTKASYDSDTSLAGTQDFLRRKPRIAPVTFSIFPAEHEPLLTNTTA